MLSTARLFTFCVVLGALACCAKPPASKRLDSTRVRELVFQMRVDDSHARRIAGDALRESGVAAVPDLIALLHAQDSALDKLLDKIGEEFTTPASDWHAYAASALGEIGPQAASAIPDLVAATSEVLTKVSAEHRDFVTVRARAALIKIREEPLIELEASLDDLQSPDWSASLAIAQELGVYGRPLIPTLTHLFSETATPKRYSIVNALGRIGGAGAASMPALLAALCDEDDSVRWFALRVLRHAQFPSANLREAIAARLTDPARSVRQQAIETLANIVIPEERSTCARLFEPLFQDPAEEVRATAKLRLADLTR